LLASIAGIRGNPENGGGERGSDREDGERHRPTLKKQAR